MLPKINLPSSITDWSSEIKSDLFDIAYSDAHISAIDSFLEKNKELNLLILDPTGKHEIIKQMMDNGEISKNVGGKILARIAAPITNSKLLNLILLGYISSVEAYLRKLIRELVNLDIYVREKCEQKTIKFGATFYQPRDMMPEALLEGISFTNGAAIIAVSKDYLGIPIQISTGSRLAIAFHDFDSICQLRHCIVHRFGNIGVNNIISLGIHGEEFKECIEKPIRISYLTIQKASKVTANLVRELNQHIFEGVIKRLAEADDSPLTWDYRSDKKLFIRYVRIFFESTNERVEQKIRQIYIELRKNYI